MIDPAPRLVRLARGIEGFSRVLAPACEFAGWLGALMFACVAILMLAQAGSRVFGFALIGGDEIAGWLSAGACFVALAYTFRNGGLIRMELLLSKLQPPRRRVAELAALAVGSIWCGYMAASMMAFVAENASFHERSTGLISIPIWTVQAPAVLGLVLLFMTFVEQLMLVATGRQAHYLSGPDASPGEPSCLPGGSDT